MARPPRPAGPGPKENAGQGTRAFEELAALRGKLKRSSVDTRPRASKRTVASKSGPTGRDGHSGFAEAPAAADDAAAFRAAVSDATPLADGHRRAEIRTPKPAPVPRPRASEPEDDATRPGSRPQSLDGPALFRAAMGDVTPLESRYAGRVDPGNAGPPAYPKRRLEPDKGSGGNEGAPLILPPDADAADPAELFRYATRGTQPIDERNRVALDVPAPLPEPRKRVEDEQSALRESLETPMTLEDRLDTGDEPVFLRPGLPRRVLTDLRRGRWVLQGEVDLHGCKREEAREALACFLAESLQRGHRCVRVIHGKGLGSPGRFSILKQLSRGWLAQREEILAFCQASPHEGGSGALLVLLRTRQIPNA
jgi:DNA-nicking Smr family endonuclease